MTLERMLCHGLANMVADTPLGLRLLSGLTECAMVIGSNTALPAPVATSGQDGDGRSERLRLAAAEVIAHHGVAAASARSIAAAAGMAPSAINYNHGSLERLLSATFTRGLADTASWLKGRIGELAFLPATPDAAALALEDVIVQWTAGERSLAVLYQECLATSLGSGVAADWTRLWRDFWLDVAEQFGLDPLEGRLLHVFFESEALHNLSRWSPALERGALREMCEYFAETWLGAIPRLGRGALDQAERIAGAKAHGTLPPAALRIAEAAAEVVEDKGLGGLTHRAVAARAGLTTGSVTHHFRSIEDLLAGAIRGQVQLLMQEADGGSHDQSPPAIDDVTSVEHLIDAIQLQAGQDRPPSPLTRRRSLFLATIHRPDLATAGAVIRFSYGGTVREALGRLRPGTQASLALTAGVLSRLLSALWYACSAEDEPRTARERLSRRINERFVVGLRAG
ncbi:TetR/AcrR family transcriptional regulator [Caulobacter henricii]|uniref:TetR/AcrR family transcriptional regulator n=2 Tax=Caulobacter henricii TaxID=69395 RepID=UPI000A042176|nr:TetR/AcrR family transcriptional regulator [Caulobacter henricii]